VRIPIKKTSRQRLEAAQITFYRHSSDWRH